MNTFKYYYPFGMPMPGRSLSLSNYRFGFNSGSEKDDEIYGHGNLYTTEWRELDTRLGRWWSIDKVLKSWETPYAAFANSPIYFSDPLGLNPESDAPVAGPDDQCGNGNYDSKGNGPYKDGMQNTPQDLPEVSVKPDDNFSAPSSAQSSSTPKDNSSVNKLPPLYDIAKSGKAPVSIFDAFTAKLTIGQQGGFDIRVLGKPELTIHSGKSVDFIGINKGELIPILDKNKPVTEFGHFGIGGFGVDADVITFKLPAEDKLTYVGSTQIKITTQKTIKESTLSASSGIMSVGTTLTEETTTNIMNGSMYKSNSQSPDASVNYEIGLKASAIIGIDISFDIVVFMQGLENLRK